MMTILLIASCLTLVGLALVALRLRSIAIMLRSACAGLGRPGPTIEDWPVVAFGGPPPAPAVRVLLPMSSEVRILPGTRAVIANRPLTRGLQPTRIIVGGISERWLIEDVRIGGRPQLLRGGDGISGAVLTALHDGAARFDPVQVDEEVELDVVYLGSEPAGEPFLCTIVGTALPENPPRPTAAAA